MEEKMHIEDGSNDRAYFTLVPNIVLNHSSAVDQALYLQMKRFAGEKNGGGYCAASKKTLKEKLNIGHKALTKSLDYLIEHGWVALAGTKQVWTEGGPQTVEIYRVNDIWKINTDHYKGCAESDPLNPKGVLKVTKGVLKVTKGVPEAHLYRTNRTIDSSEQSSLSYRIEATPEKEQKEPKPQKAVYEPILRWAEGERGSTFVHRPKQYKALKEAREVGIKSTELKERWLEMTEDKFWQEKGFDWTNVVNSFNRKGV